MTDQFILECCLGNRSAASFCRAYIDYAHSIDDLIDRDNPDELEPEKIVRIQAEMFATLAKNEFFLANRDGLLALMLQGFTYWAQSMEWEKSDDQKKINDRDVIKGFYHSVFYHVCMLVGGYDHERKIMRAHLEFDHESVKE